MDGILRRRRQFDAVGIDESLKSAAVIAGTTGTGHTWNVSPVTRISSPRQADCGFEAIIQSFSRRLPTDDQRTAVQLRNHSLMSTNDTGRAKVPPSKRDAQRNDRWAETGRSALLERAKIDCPVSRGRGVPTVSMEAVQHE
jgi:hypothetical protein